MIDRRVFYHFDYTLILLLLPLIGASLYLVHEMYLSLFYKQLVYIAIGCVAFFIAFFFPIRKLVWVIPFFYFLNLVLLLLVDLFGISILGAQRWLKIPLIGITIQPSEFMKSTLILMIAYYVYNNPPPKEGYGVKHFMKLSIIILVPFLLIAKEPDLGTALILMIIGYGTLFVIGVNYKIWIVLGAFTLIFIPFSYHFLLKEYQKGRVDKFFGNPSYHVQQSIITIGSGGVVGKKKSEATQTQLKFLPVASSDFIFAYLVERFGFLGAFLLLINYFLLIAHLFIRAKKLKYDYFAVSIFSSVAIMIFVYSYVNIAMTMDLAPVVGVPLPLMSHGGTSFINFMLLFGILERLLAFRFNFIYNFSSKNCIKGH